ncbi:hypothetical protein DL546_006325 [Coniochaeta pulveracea]|uniref:Uncharacterized protein n=1 Tax=Coniochaeta pulveracea TaxID=177199 RepID=A0A420Y7J8_9PEZI|nr:hypothetical protein DL546_006325 [Coniochaeta pulveracea]
MPSTLSTFPLLLTALLLSILSIVQGAPLSLPSRTFIYSKQQIHIQLLHANHTEPTQIQQQKLPHQVTELEKYTRNQESRTGGVRLDDLLEAPDRAEEVDVRVWMEGMRGVKGEEIAGYGELMVVSVPEQDADKEEEL